MNHVIDPEDPESAGGEVSVKGGDWTFFTQHKLHDRRNTLTQRKDSLLRFRSAKMSGSNKCLSGIVCTLILESCQPQVLLPSLITVSTWIFLAVDGRAVKRKHSIQHPFAIKGRINELLFMKGFSPSGASVARTTKRSYWPIRVTCWI